MDEAVRIPGTNFRIGLDSIVGLVPGIGDAASLLTTGYIIYHSAKLGVRRRTIARMTANAVIDFAGGSIPLVGDVFDAFFKANRKNADLLERELARLGHNE